MVKQRSKPEKLVTFFVATVCLVGTSFSNSALGLGAGENAIFSQGTDSGSGSSSGSASVSAPAWKSHPTSTLSSTSGQASNANANVNSTPNSNPNAIAISHSATTSTNQEPQNSHGQSNPRDPASVREQTQSFINFIKGLSPTGWMNPNHADLIMDNRKSFEAKIALLDSARAGDRVYLFYYIHANDETTSLINQKIIEASRRGATVHILTDFLTNYTRLDVFNMIKSEGAPNKIDIRFFNPPTANVHQDVLYLTTNCLQNPRACAEEKRQQVERSVLADSRWLGLQGENPHLIGTGHFFSRLFLAGLSAKNPASMKLALLEGGYIPESGSSSKELTDKEKSGLMEFMQLLIGAKVLNQTSDKIKLALAMMIHGDDLLPLYETLDKVTPLNLKRATPSGADWEEISQFLHHKLLAVVRADGGEVRAISGGRNNENSYHLSESMRHLISKYLFYDTDISYQISNRDHVSRFHSSIRNLFDHGPMVIGLEEVNRLLPVDYVYETETIRSVIERRRADKKSGQLDAIRYAQMIEAELKTALRGKAEQREQAEKLKMEEGANTYRLALASALNKSPQLPEIYKSIEKNDPNARFAYLENLPYRETRWSKVKRSLIDDNQVETERIYSPDPDKDASSNKNIHAAWVEWLRLQAEQAKKEGQIRDIIIHQGYVFLPSNLVTLFGEMMDGRIDASHLRLIFLSNSLATTDLTPINIYARHQFKALVEYFDLNRAQQKPGILKDLKYYEFQVLPDGNKSSAHSKGLFGPDSFFIGSANFDVRSYETDTNNGILVVNAPKTAKTLQKRFYDSILDPKLGITKEVSATFRKSHNEILQEDLLLFDGLLSKYKGLASRVQNHRNDIQTLLIDHLTNVYAMTGTLIDRAGAHLWLGRSSQIPAPGSSSNSLTNSSTTANQAAPSSRSGLRCVDVFSPGKPMLMNSRSEMIRRTREYQKKPAKDLMRHFDRLKQLI